MNECLMEWMATSSFELNQKKSKNQKKGKEVKD